MRDGGSPCSPYAALRSAALNGHTNRRMITDKAFAEAKLKEFGDALGPVAEERWSKAYGLVTGKLS